MSIRGLGRLKQAGRKLRNRFKTGALILLYHRVATLPTDPQRLAVTPDNFEAHLEIIKQKCVPVSLQHLVQGIAKRAVIPRSVAITFDDGAADNLTNAKPLLLKSGLPATVFVATGYSANGREYWWDEVDRILLQPSVLPEKLELRVNENVFSRALGNANVYDEKEYVRFSSWSANEQSPTERHQLYQQLIEFLLSLLPDDRLLAIEQLNNWAGKHESTRPTHRPLTLHEVKQLADDGSIEIGAHTVSHSVMSSLPTDVQRREIVESKTHLEGILGHSIRSFAYPFGTLADYTKETVGLVKEAGFEYACSNYKDVVQPGVDVFQLPRVIVRNWSGDEFQTQLENWFRG